MASILKFGKRLVSHPVAVTTGLFGLIISTFAYVDYNRDMKITTDISYEFKAKKSEHLGEALAQLHSKAFSDRLTYDNIKANRYRTVELIFLFKKMEQKAEEFAADPLFAGKDKAEIEALAASEYQVFAQKMFRRSMIRNSHPIKWFNAVIQDEFVKVFLLPLAGFFGVRYLYE